MKGKRKFRWGRVALIIGVAFFTIWTFFPIYWVGNMSFMFNAQTLEFPTPAYPKNATLCNYIRLWGLPCYGVSTRIDQRGYLEPTGHGEQFRRGFKNSTITAFAVMAATFFIAIPVAYAMGRLQFRRKTPLLYAIVCSRAYPPVSLIIPFYLVFSYIGLRGTIPGLMLMHLTSTIPLIVWVMMGFFAAFSRDFERAAQVDGLTRWQALWKVFVPMAWPGIAASLGISFMMSWNEFAFAWILNAGSPAATLPPALAGMMAEQGEPTIWAAAAFQEILVPVIIALMMEKKIQRLNLVSPY